MNITQMLPFLIPIALIVVALQITALIHILTHKTYKWGTRILWVLLSFIEILGPIAYFVWGKSDE